jgi:hypothetical protein
MVNTFTATIDGWPPVALPFNRTGGEVRSPDRLPMIAQPKPTLPRETATSSFLVEQEKKLAQVAGFYEFRSMGRVRHFLERHPALIDLLLEAPEYLQRCFGPDPQVVLQVVLDPELDDSEELFAYIRTALPVDDALEQLDRLDKEWLLAQLPRTGGRFNIDVEFV